MRPRALLALIVLVLAALSCNRDPEVAKRKYLESGNRYFDKGQFKEASIMYRQALRKDPRYGEAYHRLALTDIQLGRVMEATRSLRRAIELLPESVEPKTQLADIYLAGLMFADRTDTRQLEYLGTELKSLADSLLKRDPKSVHGLRYTGYWFLSKNNLEEAIKQFRAANAVSPGRADVVLPLSQALISNNQAAEAERLAKELQAKEKTFGPIYDVLYVQYMKTNRVAEAEQLLKTKVENNPNEAAYLLQLAAHYHRSQRQPEMQTTLNRITAKSGEFANARQLVGDFHYRRGDFDGALAQFDKGIVEEPKQKLAFQKRKAQVLIDQGKRREAVALLNDVLKEDSSDAQAQAMRASLLIETGTREEVQTAISELQAAVSRMPANPVLRFNLGRALMRRGEIEQARIQFEEALKRQANYLPPRLALAEIRLTKREYPQAAQIAKEILDVDPRNLKAKLIRSAAQIGLGNVAQARTDLASTIKEHPESNEAVLQLAMIHFMQKDFKPAEQIFLKLHQTAPNDLRALMGLTEVYAAQGQYGKATGVLRAELQKAPDREQLQLALANLAVRSKQFDVALAEYTKLIQKNPKSGGYYLRLGETFRLKGDLKAAVDNFFKARDLMPNEPAAHLSLALALDFLGRRDEARGAYEQILRLEPDHPVALNNLAYILAETGGDLDRALALAEKAKQKLPQDLNVADTLGWIYIRKNLADNAIEIFRDLTRRQPDNSTFHYHFAMALFQKGDKPQARRALELALQKKPAPEEAGKIKELLAKVS